MTPAPHRLWARSAHHAAFKCGGWAFARLIAGERSGQAGGDRNTTPRRMALAGLVAALKDLPPGAVAIDLGDAAVAALARKIAAGQALAEDETPSEDLDLWAALTTALKGRAVTFTASGVGAKGGPQGFAQAWAELAMDKAKMGGAFVSAIPKPHLAKVEVG